MSVSINSIPSILYYYPEVKSKLNHLQASFDRSRAELKSLGTQRAHFAFQKNRHIFELCKTSKTTIIFGNLGRNPLMVTYFLDLIFESNEKVCILTQWNWNTPYSSTAGQFDFLVIIEPCFDACIISHPNVKHLIVLTSHLSLKWPSTSLLLTLHVGDFTSLPSAERGVVFTPPLYHQEKNYNLPNETIIDVTHYSSEHNAYLGLLTGIELTREKLYQCKILDCQLKAIKKHVSKTMQIVLIQGWTDFWIRKVYKQLWQHLFNEK